MNLRPLPPQGSALAKLSYAPTNRYHSTHFRDRSQAKSALSSAERGSSEGLFPTNSEFLNIENSNARERKPMKKWLLVLGAFLCLYLVLPVPFASAAEWTEIRTDDQTLYVSPGVWRITAGNPSSSSSIDVNKPIHASTGRLVGYAAEIREPWRFILQQAVPSGWRNPGLYDQR